MTLAELIVKLKLQGLGETKGGIKDVDQSLEKTGNTAQKSGGKIDRYFVTPLKNTLSIVGKVTGVLTTLGAVAGGFLVKGAEASSLAYTELSARLKAVTGSADAAARKLAYAQAVANPSNFTFSQLANATTLLEAFDINAERALPTVARLGMAFGAGSEQLAVLVRGLGDLSTGKFLESDVAASFGLNRQLFETKGIKFDGQGQLLSSATETLEALEAIVNEKYGGIFDEMASTPGAKLASLQDSWEKLQRVIGDGILKVGVPAMERLTALVGALGNSGVAVDVVNAIANGMQRLFGGIGQGDGMLRFVSQVLSVMATLPDTIGRLKDYTVQLFSVVAFNVSAVFNYVVDRTKVLLSVIGRILTAFGHAFADISLLLLDAVGALDKSAKTEMPQLKSLPKLDAGAGPLSRADEFYNRLKTAMAVPQDNRVPEARGAFLNNPQAPKQLETLQKIERNTKSATDLLSLRAQATGPGAAGVISPTAAELQGGSPTARRIQLDMTGPTNDLTRFVQSVVRQTLSQGVGSGSFVVR